MSSQTSMLNTLVGKIADRCEGKQVLVPTHSSFVLNKLGLDRLVLLTPSVGIRLTELPQETLDYFKRLPGYDTLRVALAERIILVEGPSDELVVQRAFLDAHGKLPLEGGVDVIADCLRTPPWRGSSSRTLLSTPDRSFSRDVESKCRPSSAAVAPRATRDVLALGR